MNKNIEDALNSQIRMEFESAFLYLAFSIDLRQYGLAGAAHWMLKQYREETDHALALVDYLQKRGAYVLVPQIRKPEYSWENPVDLFRMALTHEKQVSESINSMVTMAREHKDYATESLLFEYVKEQIEEEDTVADIVQTLALCGGIAVQY